MEEISHKGKVVSADPQFTTVEIISESACSACHASALCGLSEFTKKAVSVPTKPSDPFDIGEEVEVTLKASMGHKAVWIAYVIPLFVLLLTVLVLLGLKLNEALAGLCGILATACYYLVIWLLREKLRNEYDFYIKHIK